MLDVCLLGTAGMMPQPHRWLTALMTRYNGSSLLIDCGEGTQIAMKEAGLSPNPIDIICFTHYHADHISGLPGLLLSMGNSDRTEPVIMIGPKGLKTVVNALRVIAPELPFPIEYVEIDGDEASYEINGYHITAYKVKHNITCYGYTIDIPRAGKFSVDAAKSLGLPVQTWSLLQKGNNVEFEGKTYTPDMVMGPDRRGIRLAYCTDSRPCEAIVSHVKGADLFICEGMYAEKDKLPKAKKNKHMTFYEAAQMAQDAQVEELWLTHFSPSLVGAKSYMGAVKKIFANAYLGEDGKKIELDFVEE